MTPQEILKQICQYKGLWPQAQTDNYSWNLAILQITEWLEDSSDCSEVIYVPGSMGVLRFYLSPADEGVDIIFTKGSPLHISFESFLDRNEREYQQILEEARQRQSWSWMDRVKDFLGG